MKVLKSRVHTRSETFQTNREANLAAVQVLEQELEKSRAGGGERYVQRHLDRGKPFRLLAFPRPGTA